MAVQSDDTQCGTFTDAIDTGVQLAVLEFLTREGEGRQVEIADRIDVSQAAVSRAKDALVEAGLVEVTHTGTLRLATPFDHVFGQLLFHLEDE